MNDPKQVIIALVKSILEQIPCNLISEDINWGLIFKLSQKAQITPLIYESIVINFCNIPAEICELFERSVFQHLIVQEQQQYHLTVLAEAFNKEKIDFVPLKGASINKIYPKPIYRTMSDIDILIKDEQYPVIRKVMLQLGYTEGMNNDHEYSWMLPPYIHIELHKIVIPSYNQDFYSYFQTGWQLTEHDNHHQHRFSPEYEFILLFTHFAKHYRDSGIGIRHFIDLWLYRKHYPGLNETFVIDELKKLHLDKFYLNVLDTIDTWFYNKQETVATQIITNTIFQSGAYGFSERASQSNALKLSKKHKNIVLAKLKFFMSVVFLPKKAMQNKYPVLRKVPFLLPVFWIYRWAETLLFKISHIKRQKEKAKLITSEDAALYQQELNAVGLDFNF